MFPEKIFFVGYMGSGKTTLGKKIAKKLNINFYDSDDIIEQQYGKKISKIFKEDGERKFRELESACFHELVQLPSGIISTGGGLPCVESRMEIMNQQGLTVYLRCTPKFLLSRLMQGSTERPLISGMNADMILNKINTDLVIRTPFYSKAHCIIDADAMQLEEALEAIVKCASLKTNRQ